MEPINNRWKKYIMNQIEGVFEKEGYDEPRAGGRVGVLVGGGAWGSDVKSDIIRAHRRALNRHSSDEDRRILRRVERVEMKVSIKRELTVTELATSAIKIKIFYVGFF